MSVPTAYHPCQQIQLKYFLEAPPIRDAMVMSTDRLYDFTPPLEVSEHSECALCRLLAASSKYLSPVPPIASIARELPGRGLTLKDKATLIGGLRTNVEGSLSILPLGADAHILGRKPHDYARLFEGNTISRQCVRSWLTRCTTQHSACRKIESNVSKRSLSPSRLLNTQTMTVERISLPVRYLALSYAWGRTPRTIMEDIENLFSLVSEPNVQDIELPLMIRNAIRLTAELGEKYLWIDVLCINQCDPAEKLREIKRMNEIYLAAVMTIVPLSCDSVDNALPGVDDYAPSRFQRVETWDNLRFTTVEPSAPEIYYNTGCAWNARCWTFQEHLLSRRILFLGPQQAYFGCCTTMYSEDRHESDDLNYKLHRQPGKLFLDPSAEYKDVPWQVWKTFTQIYSDKSYSQDADRLLAFQGLLGEQQKQWGLATIDGVPLRWLPLGLAWWHKSDILRDQKTNPRRIDQYPSWSWGGWSDRVFFHDFWRYCSVIQEVTIISGLRTVIMQYNRHGEVKTKRHKSINRPAKCQLLPITDTLPQTSPPVVLTEATSNSRTLLRFEGRCVSLPAGQATETRGILSIKLLGLQEEVLMDSPYLPAGDISQVGAVSASLTCVLLGLSQTHNRVLNRGRKFFLEALTKRYSLRISKFTPLYQYYKQYEWLFGLFEMPDKHVLYERLDTNPQPTRTTMSTSFPRRSDPALIMSFIFVAPFGTLMMLIWWTLIPVYGMTLIVLACIDLLWWYMSDTGRVAHVLWIGKVGNDHWERKGIGQMRYSLFNKLKPQLREIKLI